MARLQARIQKLERVLPPMCLEDPEIVRGRIALQSLPTERLEHLITVFRAKIANQELTASELETEQVFNTALAAIPMPVKSSSQSIGRSARAYR
jgi:hypothetical protein